MKKQFYLNAGILLQYFVKKQLTLSGDSAV